MKLLTLLFSCFCAHATANQFSEFKVDDGLSGYEVDTKTAKFDFKLTALLLADPVLAGISVDNEEVYRTSPLKLFHGMSLVLKEQSKPSNGEGKKDKKTPQNPKKEKNQKKEKSKDDEDYDRFQKLADSFTVGERYLAAVSHLIKERQKVAGNTASSANFAEIGKKVQSLDKELFELVKEGKEVTIPSGWPGHTVVLSLIQSSKGKEFFDVRVFNVGEGTDYHQWFADSSGIYLKLIQPWVSYVGIPYSILDDGPFFTLTMMNLNDNKMPAATFNVQYFYTEFLGNFNEYRVEEQNQLSLPYQNNGFGTISSSMARILFEYSRMSDFLRARIKIATHLLEKFVTVHEKDEDLLKMIKTNLKYRKIFVFAVSSLAQNALNMIKLQGSEESACYPTTEALKLFMKNEDTEMACQSKIKPEIQQVLRNAAGVSVKIMHWLGKIDLDMSNYGVAFSGDLNTANLAVAKVCLKSFAKNAFLPKTPPTTLVFPDPIDNLINTPSRKPFNEHSDPIKALYDELQAVVNKKALICPNLLLLTKNIDSDHEIPDNCSSVSADQWRELYAKLTNFMSMSEGTTYDTVYHEYRRTANSQVNSLDCLISFQILSFHIWKIAVKLESKKTERSLDLKKYLPPLYDCQSWNIFGYEVYDAKSEEIEYFKLSAYSVEVFGQKEKLCKAIDAYSQKIRTEQAVQPVENNIIFATSFDQFAPILNKAIEDALRSTDEVQALLMKTVLYKSYKSKEDCEQIVFACANDSSGLPRAYPEFYLALMVAAGSNMARTSNFASTNRCNVCSYKFSKYDRPSDNGSIGFIDYNKKFARLVPAISRIHGKIYTKKTITQTLFPNSKVCDVPFLNRMEHLNYAGAFENADFQWVIDRLLYSSSKVNEIMNIRPFLQRDSFALLGHFKRLKSAV